MIKRDDGWFKADNATVVGDVRIGDNSSIWYGAVIRGDEAYIEIGKGVNVQDCAVLHPQPGIPLILGDDISVGHGAVIHGRRVGSGCLIGMGAILLDGCEIGEGSIIGAGALIPERKVVPPGSVVRGVPGRISRQCTDDEKSYAIKNAREYVRLAESHASGEIESV